MKKSKKKKKKKKLRNINVSVIQIILAVFGTVPKKLEKKNG